MSTTAQQLERAPHAARSRRKPRAVALLTPFEEKVFELKKKLKKEEAEWKPPPHPA